MTPRSIITIVHVSPYGERTERGENLLPASTFGDSIAEAIFKATHESDLGALKQAFSSLNEYTPVPQWDGSWENQYGRIEVLGQVFRAGRLGYVSDLSGKTQGANGTLFVQPG